MASRAHSSDGTFLKTVILTEHWTSPVLHWNRESQAVPAILQPYLQSLLVTRSNSKHLSIKLVEPINLWVARSISACIRSIERGLYTLTLTLSQSEKELSGDISSHTIERVPPTYIMCMYLATHLSRIASIITCPIPVLICACVYPHPMWRRLTSCVVQMEPTPMPTRKASTPDLIRFTA